MYVIWIIISLLVGGIAAALSERLAIGLSKWVTLLSLVVASILALSLLSLPALELNEIARVLEESEMLGQTLAAASVSPWLSLVSFEWIPRFGINFLFAVDGVSLVLIILTLFLGFVALLTAWKEIDRHKGFFYFNFLWTLAGVVGIFSALDLFLFFIFWEVMLIPMFFIIIIWGHEGRYYAAIKFFIYTQASSLLMLVALLMLVFISWRQTGEFSFSWFDLLGTKMDLWTGMLLMLGFFVAFLVKLPGVPFHNWLPDAHTQAPTPGSVILAGILLKTGAYGLLRFIIPLFPDAAMYFTPVALTLGVISILYAAKLAFAQNDMKRLIAYSSISHMGFITIGIFSWNAIAMQGVLLQMLAHGLSSAGLFALAGAIQYRLHTRALDQLGGIWSEAPRMASLALFFAVAALGLPGLGNFVGEFLVLMGTFQVHPLAAIFSALGMIVAPVYALILMQKGFFGKPKHDAKTGSGSRTSLVDFGIREMLMMGVMVAGLIVMGLFPRVITTITEPALANLQQLAEGL